MNDSYISLNKGASGYQSAIPVVLLIEYYKKYTLTHELKTTNDILKWTNQYKEDTDTYLQFVNECIIKTNDENDKIHSFF